MKPRIAFQTFLTVYALLSSSHALAQDGSDPTCGTLYSASQYGPFDYRTASKTETEVVVVHHFTQEVESLRSGISGPLGSDIDYTLRAIPNHARALVAMQRLSDRDGVEQPKGAHFTISCYYERALRFRSDDNIVRMLYAGYLTKKKRIEEAVSQLDYVASIADPENPLTQYNLARLYLGAGQAEKAWACALKAEALGKSIDDLRGQLDRLQAPAGAASKPPPASSVPAASASSAG